MNSQGIQRQNIQPQMNKKINYSRVVSDMKLSFQEIKMRRRQRLRELYLQELDQYEMELSQKGLSIVKER